VKNCRYTDICIPRRIGQYSLGDHPRDNILGSWCAAHSKIVIAFALRFVQLSDAQNAQFPLLPQSYAGALVQLKSPEGARSKDSLAKMRRIFQFHLGSNVSVFCVLAMLSVNYDPRRHESNNKLTEASHGCVSSGRSKSTL
jgi:hypothetical protein